MTLSRGLSPTFIIAALLAAGVTATPASAENGGNRHHRIKSQQQVIADQQRQIEANQRQILAQQAQIARQGAGGPVAGQDTNRGILGNIGNCPPGTRYSLFEGCLPAVYVVN